MRQTTRKHFNTLPIETNTWTYGTPLSGESLTFHYTHSTRCETTRNPMIYIYMNGPLNSVVSESHYDSPFPSRFGDIRESASVGIVYIFVFELCRSKIPKEESVFLNGPPLHIQCWKSCCLILWCSRSSWLNEWIGGIWEYIEFTLGKNQLEPELRSWTIAIEPDFYAVTLATDSIRVNLCYRRSSRVLCVSLAKTNWTQWCLID